MSSCVEPRFRQRVYGLVREIPHGRVATYGQLAHLAGFPRHARRVGQALAALGRDEALPWHRVVNSRGEISPRVSASHTEQRVRLEAEGVAFDEPGRIDLRRWQWRPDVRRR